MSVIYTSIESANAAKCVGQAVISVKWNTRKDESGKEIPGKVRAICVDMESLGVSEIPESFRPLVKKALEIAAENQLKDYVNDNGMATEIPGEYLTRPALSEAFIGQTLWIERDRLEILFTKSALWISRVNSPKWESEQYRKLADKVKAEYLSLAGKKTRIEKEKAETLLAIIPESDLDSEFGIFVSRRLGQMISRAEQEVDYSAF
jgi:hypothetical protein